MGVKMSLHGYNIDRILTDFIGKHGKNWQNVQFYNDYYCNLVIFGSP